MSENVAKLVGVAAMAVLVVVGIAVTSGDDTDFSRNTAIAKGGDETSFLLKSIQVQVADISSQLQTVLMAQACPGADPASWTSYEDARQSSECVRNYLVGFPLELAREVVLADGKFGFFHRFNFDLAEVAWYSFVSASPVVTEEACGTISYVGRSHPPRWAIAVDTKDGVVLHVWNSFFRGYGRNITGYMQQIEHWDLLGVETTYRVASHWPSMAEAHGYCE